MNIKETISRFWRWHPKIALRYLPIVEEIHRLTSQEVILRGKRTSYKTLEIGSGSLGIAPYLGREVTGVDIDFTGPESSLLRKVKGEATNLPFEDKSFDFVVAVDVLEHLPPEKRKEAIFEAFRVAKHAVFIGVPCGKKAEEQDRILNQEYKKIFDQRFPYLEEQVRYGLPKEEDIVKVIQEASAKLKQKIIDIKVSGNLNLTVRRFLMWGWMTKNPLVDIIFRKVFLLFIPILRLCNWEPTYRKLFFIRLDV